MGPHFREFLSEYDLRTDKRWNWLGAPEHFYRARFPPLKLGESVYYLNALESVMSSHEMSVIAAENIAKMLFNDFG